MEYKIYFLKMYYIRPLKEEYFQKSNCKKSPFSDCSKPDMAAHQVMCIN